MNLKKKKNLQFSLIFFNMWWLAINFDICSVTFTLSFKSMMADVWSPEFAVKTVYHYRIYSYELTFFPFPAIKCRILSFSAKKSAVREEKLSQIFFLDQNFRKQGSFTWPNLNTYSSPGSISSAILTYSTQRI